MVGRMSLDDMEKQLVILRRVHRSAKDWCFSSAVIVLGSPGGSF